MDSSVAVYKETGGESESMSAYTCWKLPGKLLFSRKIYIKESLISPLGAYF